MTAPAARARTAKTPAPRWIVPDLIPAAGLTVFCGPSAADLSLIGLDLASAAVSGRPFAGEPDETRAAAAWRAYLFGEHYRRGIGPRVRALAVSRPDYDAEAMGVTDTPAKERVYVGKIVPEYIAGDPVHGFTIEEGAEILTSQRPPTKGPPEIILAIIAAPEPLKAETVRRLRHVALAQSLAIVVLASGEAAGGVIHHAEDEPPAPVDSVLDLQSQREDRGELRSRGRTIARYRIEVGQIAYHSPTGEPNTAAAWVEWER